MCVSVYGWSVQFAFNFNSMTIAAHNSRKAKEDDSIDVMPASVEDHFAKALGEQWSKLNPSSKTKFL